MLIFLIFLFQEGYRSQSQFDSISSFLTGLTKIEKADALLDKMWENRSNNPLLAIQLGNEAIKICRELNNKSLEAKAINFLGVAYTNMGANENALALHETALELSREVNDSTQLGYSYNNIGGIYREKKDVTNALNNIQLAIPIFENIGDLRGLAYCYINIGRLYKDQNNFENSLRYLNSALDLVDIIQNNEMRARILLDIANLSLDAGNNKQAIESFKELERNYKSINYLKGLAEVWMGYSKLYYNSGGYDLALNHAQKALKLHKQISNTVGEISTLNQIAAIYLVNKNYNQSKSYLDTSLKRAQGINDAALLAETYNSYYNLYKQQKDYSNALKYFEITHQIIDSIFTFEEGSKLAELESLIEIERKEKEKQLLKADLKSQKRQSNYLLLIIALFFLIVIILYVRYKEKKKLNDELTRTNLIKDRFFKIIAHDLREPFNAIFGSVDLLTNHAEELTEEEKNESINSIGRSVKYSFELLDNLLAWSKLQSKALYFNPAQVNLKEIIESAINLVEQKINSKNINLKLNFKNDFEVFADKQMISTVLRNLLFNSLKFTHQNGNIIITAATQEKFDVIEIEDDGIGMNEEAIENIFKLDKKFIAKGTEGEVGSGIGLILCKEFVEYHKGLIHVRSELRKGTSFIITLPKNNK